ncbi:MFS transporter [Salmonella enterica subsp. houtenae]|nr:MFS transporter [Salmonella enterica subsp. houtenae]
MVQGQSVSPRHPIFTALFGMMVLTLGMGIGRFLYTPMLPVMLAEKQLTFNELSWIASANYAGYLAGSLLFSFGLFHLPSRLRPMLLASATATGMLILAMALFTQPVIVMLVRFLAGVGAGIALGNEYVIGGLRYALSAHSLWLGAGALAGILLLIVAMLIPPRAQALPPAPLAKIENQPIPWWQLALLYGFAGFGYIIVATYLPLMAKSAGSPLLTAHLWSLVGLAIIPGCFGWLWAAKHWGVLPCLTANLLIQSACVLLSLASDSLLLLILSSIGFGATFMGTTSLVMPLARQLSAPGNINLLGLVTLTYGIGQILGPLAASLSGNGASAIINATLCGAAALFFAALISAAQQIKQKRNLIRE